MSVCFGGGGGRQVNGVVTTGRTRVHQQEKQNRQKNRVYHAKGRVDDT